MTSKSRSTLAVSAAIIALTVGVSASSMAAAHKEKHVGGKSAIQLDKHGKALKFKNSLREFKVNQVILSANIETSTATTDDAIETSTATTDDAIETSDVSAKRGDDGAQISPGTSSSTSPSPQSGRDNESD